MPEKKLVFKHIIMKRLNMAMTMITHDGFYKHMRNSNVNKVVSYFIEHTQ